jgi:hypothetical protein
MRGHVRNNTIGAAQLGHNDLTAVAVPLLNYASFMEQCLELDQATSLTALSARLCLIKS